jgi:hypothetical protein
MSAPARAVGIPPDRYIEIITATALGAPVSRTNI